MAARWGVRALLTIRGILILALASTLVPLVGASGQEEAGEGPDFVTSSPSAHPLLKGLREAPLETRLFAQFSDSEGFFTTARDQLPGRHTPQYLEDGPQVVLGVFDTLDVIESASLRQYHAAPAVAVWDAPFDRTVPLRVSWSLSASLRGAEDVHGAAPRLWVMTRLIAERDDDRVLLGWGATIADILATDGEPTRVISDLGRGHRPIMAGDRLVVELEWRWFDSLDGSPLVRPPLVSVHPGSWLDLPIVEPMRILDFRERRVLDEVYVKAEVAHLFSLRNVDIAAAALAVHGPGANAAAGPPFVRVLEPSEGMPERAFFDWVVPFYRDAQPGAYRIWTTMQQESDPAPRLVAGRTMAVTSDAGRPITAEASAPVLLPIGAFALVLVFARRRV